MAPDLADIFPSYESAEVMTQGIELIFIHGKKLNEEVSKLSLIFPTLKEKSLFNTYELQLSSEVRVIRLPIEAESESLTRTGISVLCPNFKIPDLTFCSSTEISPCVCGILNCPSVLLLPSFLTLKISLNVSPGSGVLLPFPSVLSSRVQLIICRSGA